MFQIVRLFQIARMEAEDEGFVEVSKKQAQSELKQIFHPRLRAKRKKVQTMRSILRSLFFFVESLRIQRNRGNAIFSPPLFLLGLLL